MKFKSFLAALTLAVGATASFAAPAYQFDLTGQYATSWQLQAPITPDFAVPGAVIFFSDVEFNKPGSPPHLGSLYFYGWMFSGGFYLEDGTVQIYTMGPQLYTDTEGFPAFTTGTFELSGGLYTVTISEVGASDVPEPGSLALLGLGLAGIAVARLRKQS
jgi:hypothetical protein